MTLFFVMLVVKLADIAAIASFILGLFEIRNATGYPIAIFFALVGHNLLRKTQVLEFTWDATESMSISAGLAASCLAFFIGKALRKDIRN